MVLQCFEAHSKELLGLWGVLKPFEVGVRVLRYFEAHSK